VKPHPLLVLLETYTTLPNDSQGHMSLEIPLQQRDICFQIYVVPLLAMPLLTPPIGMKQMNVVSPTGFYLQEKQNCKKEEENDALLCEI
jgi:hypothetical protein